MYYSIKIRKESQKSYKPIMYSVKYHAIKIDDDDDDDALNPLNRT